VFHPQKWPVPHQKTKRRVPRRITHCCTPKNVVFHAKKLAVARRKRGCFALENRLFNAQGGVFKGEKRSVQHRNSACLTPKTACFVAERGLLHAGNDVYRAGKKVYYMPKTQRFTLHNGVFPPKKQRISSTKRDSNTLDAGTMHTRFEY
jgi:hypothetical protein